MFTLTNTGKLILLKQINNPKLINPCPIAFLEDCNRILVTDRSEGISILSISDGSIYDKKAVKSMHKPLYLP